MARRKKQNGSGEFIFTGILLAILGIGLVFFEQYFETTQNSGKYLGNLLQYIYIMCAILVVLGIGFVVWGVVLARKHKVLREGIIDLTNASVTVSPKEFLKHKDAFLKNGDYTGVYVIHNTTKDLYYVGQSVRVVGRVTQHFTGHGNGDVYADYKYGDTFTINTIPLNGSGYDSIDALERNAIATYNAYNKGYNRTRGNRN